MRIGPGYHFRGAPNAVTARASIDAAVASRYAFTFTAVLRSRPFTT